MKVQKKSGQTFSYFSSIQQKKRDPSLKMRFFTALGTPTDVRGEFLPESFIRQIEDQIQYGCAGFLVMGSMGLGPMVKDREYRKVAKTAAEAVKGRVPVFVGVSDVSAARVLDRIECLEGLAQEGLSIDGVVSTAPYYGTLSQEEARTFFTKIAGGSKLPVFLYDVPSVAKISLEEETVLSLSRHPNIHGIKTGNLKTACRLADAYGADGAFQTYFSCIDLFDAAGKCGIRNHLDGMFCCTGKLARTMYQEESTAFPDFSRRLRQILKLRDVFAGMGVYRGFTQAMNLLGYEGSFAPDYSGALSEEEKETVGRCMREMGLIPPSPGKEA